MLTKDLGPLVLSLAVAGPASAEVKSATPTGFEVVTMTTISAPANQVYAALGEVGRWWSPSHTFSRDAGNLSMELHAGGALLAHAVAEARQRGAERLTILADPNAAGFYERNDAVRIGEAPSGCGAPAACCPRSMSSRSSRGGRRDL